MESLAIIAAMLAAGRMHGIGPDDDLPAWLKWLDAHTFRTISFVIFLVCFTIAAPWGIIAPLAFSLGHGNFFAMQGSNPNGNGPEKLETWGARWFWLKVLRQPSIFVPAYSWWCMGIKGFLIGLGCAPFGVVLAVVWPALYAFSFKRTNSSAFAEYTTAGCAGVLIAVVNHFGGMWHFAHLMF